MESEIIQSYPIQNILKHEFLLDVWGFMHYMFDNNIMISGSVITHSVHQWENFNSDLDLWIRSTSYEKKNEFHTLLALNGYYLSHIDYSDPRDNTEFSKNVEMVGHYIKYLGENNYKKIDLVYTKRNPEKILEGADLTINMNYSKVFKINDDLVFKIISINEKSNFDLVNKILCVNPKFIQNLYLNPYEASMKKTRFLKYNERGFVPNLILRETYFLILDTFIESKDVFQKNGYGLSNKLLQLQNEIISNVSNLQTI